MHLSSIYLSIFHFFKASNEVEAFTYTLGLLTYLLTHLSAKCSCIPFETYPGFLVCFYVCNM